MRGSSIERIVGSIPTEEKERIMEEQRGIFNEQIFRKLEQVERPKTPEELKIIDLANDATNKLREKYGIGELDRDVRAQADFVKSL